MKHKGQMLMEIVIAIGIIAVVLVGVSDLMTRSSKVVNFQKNKDRGVVMIQKLLNSYRAQRDQNPEDFYLMVADQVLDPCEADSEFKCVVTVSKTPTATNIQIVASWVEGGENYSVSLSQTLQRSITR